MLNGEFACERSAGFLTRILHAPLDYAGMMGIAALHPSYGTGVVAAQVKFGMSRAKHAKGAKVAITP